MKTAILIEACFPDAAAAWLETRRPYLAERTFKGYADHIKTLGKFFGELKLTDVDADHVREYQRMRMVRAGASLINREVSVLQQMLKADRALGGTLQQHYQALPHAKVEKVLIGALTPIEEDRLYRVGSSNPEVGSSLLLLCPGHQHDCPLERAAPHISDCGDVDDAERTFWVNQGKNEGLCARNEPDEWNRLARDAALC